MARDTYVGMSIVDPEDPYDVGVSRGTVTEVTTEGADAHIDFLAKKQLGRDPTRSAARTRCRSASARRGSWRNPRSPSPDTGSGRAVRPA